MHERSESESEFEFESQPDNPAMHFIPREWITIDFTRVGVGVGAYGGAYLTLEQVGSRLSLVIETIPETIPYLTIPYRGYPNTQTTDSTVAVEAQLQTQLDRIAGVDGGEPCGSHPIYHTHGI